MRLRFLLFALQVALAGCAAPPPARQDAGGIRPPVVEDARPTPYEEDAVDAPARLVAPIRPRYPPALRARGIEGDVIARVVVLADGSYGGGRLLESSHEGFASAARAALREARFHPARLRGRPVSSWVTVRIHFRLDE